VFHLTAADGGSRSTLHTTRIDGIRKKYLIEKHTTFVLEDQNDLAKQVVLNALRSKGTQIPKRVRSKEVEKKENG
jgi:hypothetical protein